MRNNKNLTPEEIKPGLRIKLALPTSYAHHNSRDRLKKYSWWKGKIKEVYRNGSFTVYLGSFLGTMFVGKDQTYKIIKCL